MTRDQQRLDDYLAHIIEAIKRIDCYTEDMAEVAFLNNPLVQDAVIRNFEIIGEASNNIEKHYPARNGVRDNLIGTEIRKWCQQEMAGNGVRDNWGNGVAASELMKVVVHRDNQCVRLTRTASTARTIERATAKPAASSLALSMTWSWPWPAPGAATVFASSAPGGQLRIPAIAEHDSDNG